MRGSAGSTRRAGCGLLALALLLSTARAGAAQEVRRERPPTHNRFLFTVIGAAVAGVPAYLVSGGRSVGGFCTSRSCVTGLAVVLGGSVGFLIGLEQDQKTARRLAAGPTLRYEPRQIPLGLVPESMSPFGGGAVVTGLAGAQVVYADGHVVDRARGIRGIEDAAVLEDRGLLVLATGSGLLAFPLAGDTAHGSLLDRTGGSALASLESELAVGGADQIRLLRVEGPAEEPSAEPRVQVASQGLVRDLHWNPFQRVAWALVQDRIVALAPGTLDWLGEAALPTPGLSLRVRGGRAVVAAGSEGVLLLDVTDPAVPQVVQVIGGMRFAYAADLEGDRLYVAAGPEGLMVFDLSDEAAPRVVGVGRTVRFARDTFVQDGRVWVLDREGRKVEIAELSGTEAAGR